VPKDAGRRAAKVRLLSIDIDGVMTDGFLYYGPEGDLLKRFSVRDGLGIELAHAAGLDLALLTGKTSDAVSKRAETLRVRHVLQGVRDKGAAIRQLASDLGLELQEIGHMGDDLNDIPAFEIVGFRACPSDAAERVKGICDLCTLAAGGAGAVRQTIEFILQARGVLEEAISRFLSDLQSSTGGI
jgi:3-deoxy-D-manno-octulosonate 8-phosphate phosphatase (KDO 8-P phosphatase)